VLLPAVKFPSEELLPARSRRLLPPRALKTVLLKLLLAAVEFTLTLSFVLPLRFEVSVAFPLSEVAFSAVVLGVGFRLTSTTLTLVLGWLQKAHSTSSSQVRMPLQTALHQLRRAIFLSSQVLVSMRQRAQAITEQLSTAPGSSSKGDGPADDGPLHTPSSAPWPQLQLIPLGRQPAQVIWQAA